MNRCNRVVPAIIGAFIVIMGISIITGISIPIFRIIFGLFFVYLGIVVITKKRFFCSGKRGERYFNDERITVTNDSLEKEYSLLFGKGYYDFTALSASNNKKIKISVAFGALEVKINKEDPVKIVITSAFAKASTPDGTVISFGSHEYTTTTFDKNKNYILIEADVAFGSLIIS